MKDQARSLSLSGVIGSEKEGARNDQHALGVGGTRKPGERSAGNEGWVYGRGSPSKRTTLRKRTGRKRTRLSMSRANGVLSGEIPRSGRSAPDGETEILRRSAPRKTTHPVDQERGLSSGKGLSAVGSEEIRTRLSNLAETHLRGGEKNR